MSTTSNNFEIDMNSDEGPRQSEEEPFISTSKKKSSTRMKLMLGCILILYVTHVLMTFNIWVSSRIPGPPGANGTHGLRGPQGIQGVTGPQGVQGNTGPQGNQGAQGDIGPQGHRVFRARKGILGRKGAR